MDKKELLKLIGQNIKEIRLAQNVTQQELAAKCDFEKSNMSRIEKGNSNFTIGTLNKIAAALDISIKELLS